MTTAGTDLHLVGKTVVIAGTDPAIVEIVRVLVRERALLAVVSADRQLVASATGVAESAGTPILGLTGDPAVATVWERNAPHIEQRLGPIDVTIAIGPPDVRDHVIAAFLPDMQRRFHGVVVELDADVRAGDLGDGIVHRCIRTAGMDAKDRADAVIDAVAQAAPQD